MEEHFKNGLGGGSLVEGDRFWILAYANDVVIVAKEEEVLENIIKGLEKYLEAKKLVLNVEKFKVLFFGRKNSGKKGRVVWKWRGEGIEEVKEFIYLGFVFKKNRNVRDHVKERIKRADMVMKKVWGKGEKLI
ncbi:uncharacterized protein LOC117173577 [Belonocnema kinseyi]|uniref:uncharacterized protein LOC117173577 n=1 Tax=Belonocnema kinseyi TaxID=2817044 RepID=UPI00143DFFCE|nr:uncharacterized protein LOC117173577 [Belonocnema kinseyi]